MHTAVLQQVSTNTRQLLVSQINSTVGIGRQIQAAVALQQTGRTVKAQEKKTFTADC